MDNVNDSSGKTPERGTTSLISTRMLFFWVFFLRIGQMNQDKTPDWTYVVEQIEVAAKEVEFGELDLTLKVRHGKVVHIERVEAVRRNWIHLRPQSFRQVENS